MADDRKEIIESWAQNVLKRVIDEMKVQKISPNSSTYKGTGKLRDSLKYIIYNSAGGDYSRISFFYEYYGLFVEQGVQGGQPYSHEKNAAPYHPGQQYATKQPGVRPPKPFLFAMLRQRVFSLQRIADRSFSKDATISIIGSLSESGTLLSSIRDRK